MNCNQGLDRTTGNRAIHTFPVFIFSLLTAWSLWSCQSKPTAESLSPLAKQGKAIYQTQCTACHNANPSLAGTLGPELMGSPLELVEARVMRAEYPAGYHPKRSTHTMAALPQLKDQIPAIVEYLKQP